MRFSVAGIGEAGQAGKTPRAIYLTENGPVMWGRTGEECAAVLYLDVSEWRAERPEAAIEAAFERPDGLCYPVECRMEVNCASVTLGTAETEIAGEARIEFRLVKEGLVQKSHAYRGWIEEALTGENAQPESPGKAFVDRVFEQADSANAAAQRAEAAADRAVISSINPPIIGENGNWYLYDEGAGEYADSGKPSRGDAGAQGEQGLQGEPGPKGEAGTAATVTVGTVTTGEPGTDAAVTNAGTSAATVLNFVIPRGEKGEQGQKGETGAKGDKGDPGEKGAPGKDGSDASVTAENIQTALGYAPVKDVQVAGSSVLADGVANVPLANRFGVTGVVNLSPSGGIKWSDGLNALAIDYASKNVIDARSSSNNPLIPYYLDYAVKAAMCDGKGPAWTADEQAAARERMSVENGSDFELLVDAVLEEEANTFLVQFPKPVRECIYHIWFYNNNDSNVVAQTKCLDCGTNKYYLLKYTSGITTGRGYALNGYFRYNGPILNKSIIGYASDSYVPQWTTDTPGNGNVAYMAYPTETRLEKVDGLSFSLKDTNHVLNVGATIKVWGR